MLTIFARVARVQPASADHAYGVPSGGMALEFVKLPRLERRLLQRSLRVLPVLSDAAELTHAVRLRQKRTWTAPRGRW